MKTSKGLAFTDLATIATTFILVGLSIGVGIYLNQEVGESIATTISVQNETVTFTANMTYSSFSYPYVKAIVAMYNNTTTGVNGLVLLSGNYTLYGDNAVYLNCTKITCGNGAVSLAANYTAWNSEQFYIGKNATKGMSSLSTWLPIIAVVIAAGVVISTLVVWFKKPGD